MVGSVLKGLRMSDSTRPFWFDWIGGNGRTELCSSGGDVDITSQAPGGIFFLSHISHVDAENMIFDYLLGNSLTLKEHGDREKDIGSSRYRRPHHSTSRVIDQKVKGQHAKPSIPNEFSWSAAC